MCMPAHSVCTVCISAGHGDSGQKVKIEQQHVKAAFPKRCADNIFPRFVQIIAEHLSMRLTIMQRSQLAFVCM